MVTQIVDQSVIAAIGNFDGVHLGHQHLIQRTQEIAFSRNAKAGVVLFDPHPRYFFQPESKPFLLSQRSIVDELLHEYGIEIIHRVAFDEALATLSPQAFVEDILIKKLNLSGILVGSDFRFGAKRIGDGAMLKSIGEDNGLSVHLVEPVALPSAPESQEEGRQGQFIKIGSSGIRDLIKAGDVKAASALMGHPWKITSHVIEGQKLGRTIGFPTANMELNDLVTPLHGVYAVFADYQGKRYHAVANYGRRPTVGSDSPLLEVHLFGFDGDLYGQTLKVEFIDFLREEQKFNGLEELKAQITNDCDEARAMLSECEGK